MTFGELFPSGWPTSVHRPVDSIMIPVMLRHENTSHGRPRGKSKFPQRNTEMDMWWPVHVYPNASSWRTNTISTESTVLNTNQERVRESEKQNDKTQKSLALFLRRRNYQIYCLISGSHVQQNKFLFSEHPKEEKQWEVRRDYFCKLPDLHQTTSQFVKSVERTHYLIHMHLPLVNHVILRCLAHLYDRFSLLFSALGDFEIFIDIIVLWWCLLCWWNKQL